MSYTQSYELEIKVTNIETVKGEIFSAVYNSQETFLVKKSAYKASKVPVKSKIVIVNFKNIAEGEYSVALYHDINSSGQMDRNMLGIPKEDYGFSNINSIIFSRPSFEETKFYIKSDTSIVIELQ